MLNPDNFTKDELIGLLTDAAKNWLAHDGLWFLAAENRFDMQTAIDLDRDAWEKFTVVEAKRIMKRLGMEPGCGIPALIKAFDFRLYAYINKQEVIEDQDSGFDLENRVLCPDGTCTGIIVNGKCSECGTAYKKKKKKKTD